MRALAFCLVLVSQWTLSSVGQQSASAGQPTIAPCTFDDGRQITIQYNSAAKTEQQLRRGKPWEAGGSPMILYTQTKLTVGNAEIPEGAYSLYVIPERQNWTLVVNKNVTAGSKYDESKTWHVLPWKLDKSTVPRSNPRSCSVTQERSSATCGCITKRLARGWNSRRNDTTPTIRFI
jgi:hypothetical protein